VTDLYRVLSIFLISSISTLAGGSNIPVTAWFPQDTLTPPLVWPAPPERARITHEKTSSSNENLELSGEGFFSGLFDILIGTDKTERRLVQPVGIAVPREGKIYFADPGAGGIHIIDHPQGPHGSDYRFMLTGDAKYWPENASGDLWSLNDIDRNLNNWQDDLFCVNCHPVSRGGGDVSN